MEKWPGFEEKTPEELEEQVKKTSESFGAEVAPPSEEEITEMSLDEIKEKYPRRYEIYLENLRAERREEKIDESEKKDMAKWLTTLNNLDGYIEKHKTNEEEQTLRERQFTVFEDLRDSLEHGENSGYIKLPTGVGKTVLFSEFIEATKLKTLVVVPTKILVGQTEEKIQQFAPDIEATKFFSEAKEKSGDVQITTYQSLLRQSSKENSEINPEDYDLLILDEAHKALSNKQQELIKGLDNQIKLGFTATPKYDDKKNLESLLGNEIHSMKVKEAIQEGLLSSCRVIIPKTEVDITNIKVDGGKYNEEELEKAINVETRNKAAVELYKKAFADKSGIVFAGGINHSNTLMEMFNKEGVSAEVITGKTSQKERDEILEKYKNGEIKVLIGAQVFIEGFDEPRASVCLNLAPTLSQVVAEQRAGRVLRLDPNNPDKEAYVVDFLDKNENKKIAPISFAEILDGADVRNPNTESKGGSTIRESQERDIDKLLAELKIEGLNVVVDPREVMSVIRKMIDEKYQELPEDWMTASRLNKMIGSARKVIQNTAEKYREKHPEWFRSGLSRNRLAEGYSPELVEKLKEELHVEHLPEDWMTVSALIKNRIIRSEDKTIKKIAEKYRTEHPEWFMDGRVGSKLAEGYSPELVEKLKEELHVEHLPEDWMTAGKLRRIISSSYETIKKAAEKYRDEYPEWFREGRFGSMVAEGYSPELVEKIKEDLQMERLPEGWMTAKRLEEIISSSYKTIKQAAEKYKDEHPEWFREGLSGNRLVEGYSPELVTKLKEELNIEQLPEGWMTANGLRKIIGSGYKVVQKTAEKYRAEHPEWFMEGRVGVNVAEGYSPELVEKIKEELNK